MIMCGSNFHAVLPRQIYKQLQLQKAHAFTWRSVSQFRNLVVVDGRGTTPFERHKTKVVSATNISKYGFSPVKCSCLDHWKKRTFTVGFHTTSAKLHGEYEWQDPKSEDEVVNVQIVDKDGKTSNVRGKIGDNLLYLAKRFEVEMEGACEASLACTTCHVYVDHDFLDLLPEATETEEDLLDQAPFLKENSRLGCQIILNKQLDGIQLKLPTATKNFYVDGHKPTPH